MKPEGRVVAGGRDLRHLLATTQPVDGACLISRYSAVRLRGGQLAGGATGERGALIRRRLRVQVPPGRREKETDEE